MKKLMGLLLIAMVLIGCGKKDAASGNKKEVVTVWAMGDEAIKLREMKTVFEEENEDLQIEIQAIPWEMVKSKILLAVSGGDTPDLVQVGSSLMAEYQGIGAFANLTDMIEGTDIDLNNFIESTVTGNVFEDGIYGLPWYAETRLYFYRKDVLAEMGYNEFPDNWEELLDLTGKLKAAGVKYPITVPIRDENTPTELYSFIWQNGADTIDADKNVLVNTDEYKEAIETYTGFFKRGEAPFEMGGQLVQEFSNGSLPMFIGGPWMINIVRDGVTPEMMENLGVAVMPLKETRASYIGGSQLSIFKSSNNKENAFRFMEFLTSEEGQLKWFEISNNLPTLKSVWDDESLQNDKYLSIFREQLEYARPSHNIPEMGKIDDTLGEVVERIIFGQIDVDSGMEELEKRLEVIVK